MPTFSIILPVRNGGHYVKECVASILQQSYQDFNLLVLDNQSTDGTTDWLLEMEDKRVLIFPADRPLSIEQNWARVTHIPKSEFMTLIGHDDLLDKDYLTNMDKLIRKFPDASLYQSHFRYVDASGKLIRNCQPMQEEISPSLFLQLFLERKIDLMGTGFLMRSRDYDALGGIPLYPKLLFADFELWIKLVNKGFLAVAAGENFSFRIHSSTTTVSGDDMYITAFEKLVAFLSSIKKGNKELDTVITEKAPDFLLFYCQALSHRLLRTPLSQRKGLSVRSTIGRFEDFAKGLGVANFNPLERPSIRIARWIDSNMATRSIFLTFKRIYKKPVLH